MRPATHPDRTYPRGRAGAKLSVAQLAIAVLVSVIGSAALFAQAPKPSEYQVKAVYLYNFGRFVQWPVSAASAKHDSFDVCVLGDDPFGQALDSVLGGENIGGRPAMAKRLAKPDDLAVCRIVFISGSEENRLKQILDVVDKTGVLTVSDIPHFADRGGMIGFVLSSGKVRFEVNIGTVQASGLTMSSQLLKVASSVRGNT